MIAATLADLGIPVSDKMSPRAEVALVRMRARRLRRLRTAAVVSLVFAACTSSPPGGAPPIDAPTCLPETACSSLPCLALTCAGDACQCTLPIYGPDSIPVSVACRQ